MKTMAVTALDLGNAGTRAAYVSARKSEVLVASNGRTWITTAIAHKGNTLVVGEDAEALVRNDPSLGIIGLKQLLRSGEKTVTIGETQYELQNLIGEFIRAAFPQIVGLSEKAPLVVTYPTDTGPEVRQATIAAIKASGATLLPTPGGKNPLTCDEALALAIASMQEANLKIIDGDHIYCADHGHVTGDHTMLEARVSGRGKQLVMVPIAWRGSAMMGGCAIDDAIVARLLARPGAPAEYNPHAARMAARMVKTMLSDPKTKEARFMLPVGYNDKGKAQYWEAIVDRAMFAEILQPFKAEMQKTVGEIVEQTSAPKAVVIGGGFANLPEVAQFLAEASGCDDVHVIEHPEIATVKGAALYGAMSVHMKQTDAIAVQPIVRRDILIGITEEDQQVAIPAGTPIPTQPVDFQLDPSVERFRIAEASPNGAINRTSTPVFVDLRDGKRFVRLSADLTGICLERGGNKDSLRQLDIEWASRPMVEEFMLHATIVANAIVGKR